MGLRLMRKGYNAKLANFKTSDSRAFQIIFGLGNSDEEDVYLWFLEKDWDAVSSD